MRILIFGIGNPGRQDDAVGPLLVERLEALPKAEVLRGEEPGARDRDRTNSPGAPDATKHQIDFDANYQLNVEDAEAISHYDIVYFVDASTADIGGVRLTPVGQDSPVSFSTHSVSPGGIVALAAELYGARPKVFLVEIQGYSWEPNGEPSAAAMANLEHGRRLLIDSVQAALAGQA